MVCIIAYPATVVDESWPETGRSWHGDKRLPPSWWWSVGLFVGRSEVRFTPRVGRSDVCLTIRSGRSVVTMGCRKSWATATANTPLRFSIIGMRLKDFNLKIRKLVRKSLGRRNAHGAGSTWKTGHLTGRRTVWALAITTVSKIKLRSV